jgi:WD40 repeat protein
MEAQIASLEITHNMQRGDSINCIAFHPTATPPLLATGDDSGTTKLWNFSFNAERNHNWSVNHAATLKTNYTSVNCIAFSPTGTFLATGSSDYTIKIWRISQNQLLHDRTWTSVLVTQLDEHDESVLSVVFHPTAIPPILASSSWDGKVKFWFFSEDESDVVDTLEIDMDGVANSIAFNPTGSLLATGNDDNSLNLWNFPLNAGINSSLSVNKVSTIRNAHTKKINSVAFNKTGSFLATGSSDNNTKIWQLTDERGVLGRNSMVFLVPFRTLLGHTGNVKSVAFIPTEINSDTCLVLATESRDNTIKLWYILTDGSQPPICVDTFKNFHNPDINIFNSFAFIPTSPESSFLAIGSSNSTRNSLLEIWNLSDRNILRKVRIIQDSVQVSVQRSAPVRAPQITEITIPKNLLYPKKSANKSCPNFKKLYDEIMKMEFKFDVPFRFIFQGQSGIDAKGLTRIVFDIVLPIYIDLYFKKIVGSEFIILIENVEMEELVKHTNKLINLARAAEVPIELEINPELIEFLSFANPQESISQRQNFNNLYKNLKTKINAVKVSGNNVSNFLLNNSLKAVINNTQNLSSLNKTLKNEILLRKILNSFGFESWNQFENMARFIKTFWINKLTFKNKGKEITINLFRCKLGFNIESFSTRLIIKRADNQEILDLSNIPESLNNLYPALRPLLEYILNPNAEADNNRRKFVQFVTGTQYSISNILILLTNSVISPQLHDDSPFYVHTCFSTIDLYKRPDNYNKQINIKTINGLITHGSGLYVED